MDRPDTMPMFSPAIRVYATVACPEGLEPPTYCLEGNCSIQLSYGQPRRDFTAWRGTCPAMGKDCGQKLESGVAIIPKRFERVTKLTEPSAGVLHYEMAQRE